MFKLKKKVFKKIENIKMDFNLHKELLVKKLILQILTKKKFIQPNSY